MKKKLLSLLLALCLLFSLAAPVFATEVTSGTCGDSAYWNYDASTATLTISGDGPMYDYTNELNNDNRPWFHLRDQIKNLVIGDGITRVGDCAFSDFSNMENVTFADSVTEIGLFAFTFAEKLENLELPSRLAHMGQQAFWCCRALTEVHLPGTMTFIDACIFQDCTGLKKVTIGYDPSVSMMITSNSPFLGCTALESIEVEEGLFCLKSIDGALYTYDCNGLSLQQYPLGKKDTAFVIPDNTVRIEQFALDSALYLESITVPASVEFIGASSFCCSDNLKEIIFQGSAPEMADNALGIYDTTAYYPFNDPSWTEEVMQSQHHTITWEPYNSSTPFQDVALGAFYEEPVIWAVEQGITNGYGADDIFAPDVVCNRGQVVTFLWRAAGEPEPSSSVNPFTDIKESDYFYKAVLWAVEEGITAGYDSDTIFNPNGSCTRGQVATFLWRYFDQPQPESMENPFNDVDSGEFYYTAVLWAVEQGITNGYGTTGGFAPNMACNRGQVVTFLYRALN